MSTIGPGFGAIHQEQEAKHNEALDAFNKAVQGDLKKKGAEQTARMLNTQAGRVLKGYVKIFEFIEEPISTLFITVLERIGVPPNVFIAAELLCRSDSIGRDDHEKAGLPAWKFERVHEIHRLFKELNYLESMGTLSAKIDRKKEIESDLRDRIKQLR